MKIKMTFQEIQEEKVEFHQGIVEVVSFLNTMKSPPHCELDDAVGHGQNKKLFYFCCMQNKKQSND